MNHTSAPRTFTGCNSPRSTKLIVLRGPSGSGKTATARALRERLGRRVALIEQDYLRRVVLKARDTAEGPHYGLIEQTVRYALDHGYDVILEGILHRGRYRELLARLDGDHRGRTVHYYFDISWDETLRRHADRPQAAEFGVDEMRSWWCPQDLLGFDAERLVPETAALTETTDRILAEVCSAGAVSGSPESGFRGTARVIAPARKRRDTGQLSTDTSVTSSDAPVYRARATRSASSTRRIVSGGRAP